MDKKQQSEARRLRREWQKTWVKRIDEDAVPAKMWVEIEKGFGQ